MKPGISRYRKPSSVIEIPKDVAARAASKCVEVGDCLISTYSTGSHGYSQIGWQRGGIRHMTTAHRAAWVHYSGRQVGVGKTIDHICKNRQCVKESHLRELSNFENARRTFGDDWPIGTCKNGHTNAELFWDGRRFRCRPFITPVGSLHP